MLYESQLVIIQYITTVLQCDVSNSLGLISVAARFSCIVPNAALMEKSLNRVGFAGTEKIKKYDRDHVKYECKEHEEQECNLPTRHTRHFTGL